MIDIIRHILGSGDLYGISERVDIAKGKYKIPETFREGWDQHKRKKAWRKR